MLEIFSSHIFVAEVQTFHSKNEKLYGKEKFSNRSG